MTGVRTVNDRFVKEGLMGFHTHYAVSGRQGRVLLVDDEAAVRKPIQLTLTRAGYEVIEAQDGDEAMQLLNSGDNPLMVDAILCDLHMPGVDGTDAIAYFRTHYPSVPIVVLTGFPDVEMAVALMRQGVKDYLVKPVSKEDVLKVIQKAVSQHEILKG
jgi:two-component system chemotaxis response regulator CheY